MPPARRSRLIEHRWPVCGRLARLLVPPAIVLVAGARGRG